jgi:hypothetical protein
MPPEVSLIAVTQTVFLKGHEMKITITLRITPSDLHRIHEKAVMAVIRAWELKHLVSLLFFR